MTAEVLAALRRADQAVAKGKVVYRVEKHSRVPPLPQDLARQVLEQRERQLKLQGANSTTTARLLAETRRRALMGQTEHQLYEVSVAYLDRLHCCTKVRQVLPTKTEVTEIRDGANTVRVSGRSAVVVYDKPDTVLPLIDIAPEPCFVMGRGLSGLKNPTVRKTKEGFAVSGTASDGTLIRAVVDPQHGFMARRIERGTSKGTTSVWTLSRPHLASKTVWLPSSVERRYVPRKPGIRGISKYALLSADFDGVDPSEVMVPLQGLRISDSRLGMPVGYDKVPAGVKTLDDLLPYTRKVAEDLARVQAQFDREQAKRRRVQVLIGLLFGCTAAAAGVIAWRSYRGLRRAQGRV